MVKLDTIYPPLLKAVQGVLTQMAAEGHPMRICQGVRTTEEQQKLWQQGRTTPGKIITNADGVKKKSNHQVREDGWGHAVDCCFTTGDPFGESQPWARFGELVRAAGLKWGGDWVSFKDRPHVELA